MAAAVGSSTSLIPEALLWVRVIPLPWGFGGLDDEFQVGDIAGDVCQSEGHRGCSEGDSRLCRSLNAGEVRHGGHNLATAVHDPVVAPIPLLGAGPE